MDQSKPGTGPSLQNILTLDKSTDPIATQIEVACNVLNISLSPSILIPQPIQQSDGRYGPREEWTLRWLLKKLEAAGSDPQSVCLEPKIWQLFWVLIPRLPVANLARLLRSHGFISILLKTLKAFEAGLQTNGSLIEHASSSSAKSTSRESSAAADSSSATINFSTEPSKPSKKRKRDGTLVDHKFENPSTKPDPESFYQTVCGVITRLQALVKDESHGYAVEHLRMALSASPDQAAQIVGACFTIRNSMLWQIAGKDCFLERNRICLCLDPWVEMWTLRSSRTAKTATEVTFSSASFIPALKLLSSLNDVADTTDLFDKEIAVLERLIVQHIILPARDCFEDSKHLRATQDDEVQKSSANDLLGPLQDPAFRTERRGHSEHEAMHPVARFFDIILKYTPLATTQQRISEQAWLQFMLDQVALLAPALASDPPDSTLQEPQRALKDVLQMVATKKLKLEIAMLEKILSQNSKLLYKEGHPVDWLVVGLCLEIDPDIFVVPTISKDAAGQATREPNKYLSALFGKINNLSLSSEATSELFRQDILKHVLIPLAKGFAQARDLVGFVNHWRSNILQSRPLSYGPDNVLLIDRTESESTLKMAAHSLWEEEDLLRAVAALLEQRLNFRQIEGVLKELSAALVSTHLSQATEQGLSTAANLVILDCMLSSCKKEDIVSQSAKLVDGLYTDLLALCEANLLPESQSWRPWRCIAKIRSRWAVELSLSLEVRELEERVARKAIKLLSQKDPDHPNKALLQALNFVLSLLEDPNPPFRRELAHLIVQVFVDALSQHNRHAEPEKTRRLDRQPTFHQSVDQGKDLYCFIEDYASQLCLRQNALQIATPEMQKAILESLFEYALLDSTTSQYDSKHGIPVLGPWWNYLHSGVLEDDHSFTSLFRAFQLDCLLKVPTHGSVDWSDNERAAYALAFDSIHRTPLYAFDRKQRARIFNRVLENLLQDRNSPTQLLKDQLELLICYIAHPDRSMNLICNPLNLPKDSQDTRNRKAFLTQLAGIFNSRFNASHLDLDAVENVKLLTRKVLESQLSKGMGESAVSYLKVYYEELNALWYSSSGGDMFLYALTGVSLSFYREHYHVFPNDLQANLAELSPFCTNFLKRTYRCVRDMSWDANAGIELYHKAPVFVSSLDLFTDIILDAPELALVRTNLTELSKIIIEDRLPEPSSINVIVKEQALKAIRKTQRLLGSSDTSEFLGMNQTDPETISMKEQRRLVSTLLQSAGDSHPERIAEIVTEEVDRAADGPLNQTMLLFLQQLILRRASTDVQSSAEFSTALSSLLNRLYDILLQPQPFQVAVQSLQTINIILQKYPRIITQWHVDQVMAVVTTCASRPRSSTSYTKKQISLEYLTLCRVFSSILAFHRKRLGGRYHLILLGLQSLLRPLFIPFTKADISAPSNTDHPPFTTTHASAYSRLLEQVADPPLASLTSHRHRSRKHEDLNLNDATKTAKLIAGQYLHYLIMTYCECQLKGRLEQEVRETLKPGLWAMLDVIPIEVMRVMNTAMAKDGRGVWKGVYGEWRRVRGDRGG